MSKQLKSLMREDLKRKFAGVDGGVFVRTQGLNSEQTYDFRKSLQSKNLKYAVVRNTLLRQAFGSYGYREAELAKVLKGQVGVVYAPKAEGSAMAGARAVFEWKKERKDKVVEWVGAFMDGAVMGPADAQALKDAPTKDTARAMLLGVLQAPVVKLVSTLREPAARVVYVMDAKKRKMEEGGAGAA